jgi:hypothetical protein
MGGGLEQSSQPKSMNLLQGLKNKLQVLTLKKDLKAAKQEADQSAWKQRGQQCIDGISANGKFIGNSRDRVSAMRFALAGIKEAGASPSLEPTAGLHDPKKDAWLAIKKGDGPEGVNGGHDGDLSVMSAYAELAAAIEAKGGKPDVAPSAPEPPPAPAASKPVSSPTEPPKPASTKITMPPPTVPQPAPKAKGNPALAHIPAHELASIAKGYQFTPQKRQEALNEIDSREGFFVIESTPFVEYGKYHTMSIGDRYQFSQAGGRIAMKSATAEDKKGTAAQFLLVPADNSEPTLKFTGDPNAYSFPIKTAKRRSVEDFMKLSRADINAIGVECGLNRGTALRREIQDAVFAMSWATEEGQRMRSGFMAAYSKAFQFIRSLGPSKPDTDTPPDNKGGMNAGQLLNLSKESAASIDKQAYHPDGRRTRREVKTAYMAASAGERAALLERFPYSLKREMHEYI